MPYFGVDRRCAAAAARRDAQLPRRAPRAARARRARRATSSLVANQLDAARRRSAPSRSSSTRTASASIGGTIGFTFERDHLVMVSSTALPHVAVRDAGARRSRRTRGEARRAGVPRERTNISTHVRGHGDRVIVPMVVRARRQALPPTSSIASPRPCRSRPIAAPGRWDVWVDANDGAPIARKSTLHFATGTVSVQRPRSLSARHAQPAARAVRDRTRSTARARRRDSTATRAPGATPAPRPSCPGLVGSARRDHEQSPARSSPTTLTLADGGSVTWSQSAAIPRPTRSSTRSCSRTTAKQFVRDAAQPEPRVARPAAVR